MKAKSLSVTCILACLAVLCGVLCLPACTKGYQPDHQDELVLVADDQRTVIWDDIQADGRFDLVMLQTLLGESDEDIWVSNRGNRVLVFNSIGAAQCYLEEQEHGLYSLFASEKTSFGELESVQFPVESVETMGRFRSSITVVTPLSTRQMTVKEFCLLYGLWEYEGSGKTHQMYSVENYYRKTVSLSDVAGDRPCTVWMQSGEAFDVSQSTLIYWYRGDVCVVGHSGAIAKIEFGQGQEGEV